jgi:hypothetical protein
MFTLAASAWAQTAVPTITWPPEPSQIFAQTIEVVSSETVERPIDTRPIADNERRILRVYNQETKTWKEYPYPEALEIITNTDTRSDGIIVLNEPYVEPTEEMPEIWLFNPATGEFSLAEKVCGWKAKASPRKGQWVFYTDPTTGNRHACFTETGQRTTGLPDKLGWINEPIFGSSPKPSPDGKWLALMGFITDADGTIERYEFYGYEVARDKLNYLGSIPYDMFATYPPGFGPWVSKIYGLIGYGPPQESLSKDFYAFDVSRPNSLQLIARGWIYDFYDNPPRYEYTTTKAFLEWKTGAEHPEDTPCTFLLYDATGVHQYELSYDCSFNRVLRVSGSTYIYVHTYEGITNRGILSTIDAHTGEKEEVTNGLIVYLESVSPDGRYVVLVMDGDEQIRQHYFSDLFTWENYPNGYIAIFDLLTREFVYESHRFAPPSSQFPSNFYVAEWCGNDCLLLSTGYGNSISLLTLEEGGVTERRVNGIGRDQYRSTLYPENYLSPNKQQLILNRNTLVDFDAKTITPLLAQDALQQYGIDMRWLDDETIVVEVTLKNPEPDENITLVRYTIRLSR